MPTTSIHPEESALRERLGMLGKGLLSFWFLNHELEREELARQIRQMKEKGFSGFFLHARDGLQEPYGSRSWYSSIAFCIDEARACGMEAWLYDEDPYPSGAAGGRVTLEHPEYRASFLQATVMPISGPGKHVLDLEPGTLVAAYLVEDDEGTPQITRIDDHAGIIRTQWNQFHVGAGYYPPYHNHGAPHWRAMTLNPHYRVVVETDGGDKQIVAFVRRYASLEPWGAYPDLLNPAAVATFIEYTHTEYARRFQSDFGTTIPGIFTDESKLLGQIPWSANVPALFRRISGMDLFSVLPHLALELDGQSSYIRWAYREALATGFQESFIDPLKDFCQSHRLLFVGHLSPEEDPPSQVLYVPGLMRAIGKMDIPGTDLIGGMIGDRHHPTLHLSPKLASSAAHAAGKPQVACEAFAVTDWSQDLGFLTRVANWLFALGVNRIVTHGQFYSIDGLRKREAPPSQFYQASYWEHFQAFAASIRFLSETLMEGTHEAPLLLYYPEEAFMAYSFPAPGEKGSFQAEAGTLRRDLGDLVHRLLTSGYDFDLVDATLLKEVQPEIGYVTLRDETFKGIIVAGDYITESSWHHLVRLEEAGLPVLFLASSLTILAKKPYTVHVEGHDWLALQQKLAESIAPLWRAEHGELIGHKRNTDEGPVLFLSNNGENIFSGTVELDFVGPYEICIPRESRWQSISSNPTLELAPGEGVLVRQQTTLPEALPSFIAPAQWRPLATEWGTWGAVPAAENCLLLSEFRVLSREPGKDAAAPLDDLFVYAPAVDLLSVPSLNTIAPPATHDRFLRSSFLWEGPLSRLRLVRDSDLAASPDMAFYINERPVPAFHRRNTYDVMNLEADIASLVCEGHNTLLWVQKGSTAMDSLPWPYDALRIFGDFHIDFPYGTQTPARLRKRPDRYACGFSSSPESWGHPWYHQIILYNTTFLLSVPCKRLALRFGHIHETAEVFLNGHSVGHLWSPPFLLEIDPELIRPGRNELTIACSTSPANFLQGLRQSAGPHGFIEWVGA